MKVKIIDFDSNFAVCNYRDLDGYNAYGYLHSYEINDLKLPIKEKVKIGDELEADVMYESRGDIMLTVKSMNGRTFDDRLEGLSKYDSIKAEIVKLTNHGAIAIRETVCFCKSFIGLFPVAAVHQIIGFRYQIMQRTAGSHAG